MTSKCTWANSPSIVYKTHNGPTFLYLHLSQLANKALLCFFPPISPFLCQRRRLDSNPSINIIITHADWLTGWPALHWSETERKKREERKRERVTSALASFSCLKSEWGALRACPHFLQLSLPLHRSERERERGRERESEKDGRRESEWERGREREWRVPWHLLVKRLVSRINPSLLLMIHL